MKQDSLKLPTLNKPLLSSRIASIQDYKEWEQTRKRAYHAELDRQVEQHRKCVELRKEQKSKERINISAMAEQERSKMINDKYEKIKTQQKYQQDNFRLMGKEKHKKRSREWYTQQRQHPFIKLVQEQQQRKITTKQGFIYQNKLNLIQHDMKKSMRIEQKRESISESQKYVNHVEQQFQKHLQQRIEFEKKYLKVDKGSTQSAKKQYLDYLKVQAQLQRRRNNRKRQDNKQKEENKSALFAIGDAPVTFERKKQLQIIEKSLRQFSEHKKNPASQSFSLNKQLQMKIVGPKVPNYEKVVTQRAIGVDRQQVYSIGTGRSQSSLSNSQNLIRYRQKCQNPEQKLRKQYRQYDIINNSSKLFFA